MPSSSWYSFMAYSLISLILLDASSLPMTDSLSLFYKFLIIESWACLYSSFFVLSSLIWNSKNSCFCLYIAWSFSHFYLAISNVSSSILIFCSCSDILKVLLFRSSSDTSFNYSTSWVYFFFNMSFYFVTSLTCSLSLAISFFINASASSHL